MAHSASAEETRRAASASGEAPALEAEGESESFLQATRLADARISEVVDAMSALKADNDAFRQRLEGQLSEKFEQRRQHLLVSSVQTLETLDRAIDAARQSEAAEPLIAGVMLVRTQLFRILQEEGLERVSVLGLPFDPRSAEVVQRRAVTDADQDGLVVEELQGGHQLHGHVIRRAKVVVGEHVAEEAATVVMGMPAEAKEEPAPPPPAPEMAPPEMAPPEVRAREVTPAIEPTVAMPAIVEPIHAEAAASPEPTPPSAPPATPPPAEDTTAMEVVEVEPVPPVVAPPAPPEVHAEEPIVVEDWAEPTHAGTPAATPIGALASPASPGKPAVPATPPPAPPPLEDDDDSNATMVLGDAAAVFVRPPPPLPAPAPKPTPPAPAPRAAAPPPPSPAPPPSPSPWTTEKPWPTKAQREGQPVAAPRPAPATLPPRLRTGPVPPPRDRSPVYEQRPVPPPAVAPPPPPVEPPEVITNPGLAPTPPAGGKSRGFYVGLGAVIVALLAALGVELWLLSHRQRTAEPAVAEASPLATTPAAAAPSAPSAAPAVVPEDITVVTTLPAAPPSAAGPPAGVAAAPPTVAPPALPTARPATPLAATPAGPRPTLAPAAPVNPVPALLAQAEQAVAAKHFDEAITRYNEVLKLEPQNAEAAAGKLRAAGDRASMGRYFLTAITLSEGKSSGGGIKGFDGGQVVKSQCECALMYEVAPANPVQGQPYVVSVFLRNDSKKDIKPQSITASVTVNGSASSRPITLAAKDVARGQRVMVGRIEDTWKVGTTSWSMEAAVGAGGNTYRAQLTWELRVPAGQ